VARVPVNNPIFEKRRGTNNRIYQYIFLVIVFLFFNQKPVRALVVILEIYNVGEVVRLWGCGEEAASPIAPLCSYLNHLNKLNKVILLTKTHKVYKP
jgi:hypothetical protein